MDPVELVEEVYAAKTGNVKPLPNAGDEPVPKLEPETPKKCILCPTLRQ